VAFLLHGHNMFTDPGRRAWEGRPGHRRARLTNAELGRRACNAWQSTYARRLLCTPCASTSRVTREVSGMSEVCRTC